MEAIALAGPLLASAAGTAGTVASTLGSYAPLIGAGLGAVGSIYSGVREQQNAKFEAAQLKQKGDQEFANNARLAQQKRREGRLALSRARTVAAASGAGTGDDTVTNIMAGIETKSDYNALTDMYNGMQARDDLYSEAAVRKSEGSDAMTSSLFNAGTSLYGGLSEYTRQKKMDAYYEHAGD
jgi:hypothetical protein